MCVRDINSIYHSATPEFRTHLNYVKRLSAMGDSLELKLSITNESKLSSLPAVRKFMGLSAITAKSIENDMTLCQTDPEFSRIISPWLPPKCYYRLYYLESILLYLINGDVSGFSAKAGHTSVRSRINDHFSKGNLVIKCDLYIPPVASLSNLLDFHVVLGEATRADFWRSERCTQSVLRKVAIYVKDDWTKKQGYENFAKRTRRVERERYLEKKEISIFDYFYQMRLKANYRDVDFLNLESASANDIHQYIIYYHKFYSAYARALKILIKSRLSRISHELR